MLLGKWELNLRFLSTRCPDDPLFIDLPINLQVLPNLAKWEISQPIILDWSIQNPYFNYKFPQVNSNPKAMITLKGISQVGVTPFDMRTINLSSTASGYVLT